MELLFGFQKNLGENNHLIVNGDDVPHIAAAIDAGVNDVVRPTSASTKTCRIILLLLGLMSSVVLDLVYWRVVQWCMLVSKKSALRVDSLRIKVLIITC